MSKKKNKPKELGMISHITNTNKLIIPTKITPKLGSTIINKQNKPIGKVNDIFGSTKKPYISIKTNKYYTKAKPGEVVYLSTQRRRKNKRRMKQRQAY
ncbi:Gar1/Naf1 family protein [uncultured Methanosphaera sp.]|uniref:H/ACA ribonucleoprotein complex subunit GAR1 n=1 Tax=uncultured Methanosphaera sp. TaxID=262501 RepID=UPI002803C62D|nr:Gar1/Naf1 family protein [uncultured Methanosphaera sp.]